ncbi:MAG: LOG family protein [Phycisphaerae bacterium]
MSDRKIVTVFGSGNPLEGEEAYAVAREVGMQLAELGYGVANGGYGGTMEASARGAAEAGGHVVGVTCSVWSSQPNPYIDEVVRTGKLTERIDTLIRLGEGGYVVLPGATGTLAELAMVWEGMCKHMLPKRPLVCLGFWRPLVEMMIAERPRSAEYVAVIDSPRQFGSYFPPVAGT